MPLKAGIDWVIVEKTTADGIEVHLPDDTKFMEALATPAVVVSAGRIIGIDGIEEPEFKTGDKVLVSLVGSIRVRVKNKVLHAIRYNYIIATIIEEGPSED